LIFEKILITGAGIIILLTGHGVIALCLVFLASGAISTLISTVFVHRYFFRIKLSFNFSFSRDLVRSSLPFGVSLFLGMIYNSIGIIILSKMQPAEVVGWFSAGERLLRFTGILPTILSIALFPALSREMGQSKERFADLFTKGFKYSSFLAIPMVAGITILAPTIVRILFGPEYTNTTGVLQILAWVAGLIFFNIFLAALFKAANYQKLFVKIQVAAVVLNLILNLVLIHYFAHIGASIAMLATEGMIFCIGLAFALYKISKLQESLFILKVLGATCVMSLVTMYLRDYNLALVVVISTLIYFGVLYLLNGFILREFLLLRRN
jgi:O-antigen/teichoic acid export membrane protein